MIRSGRGPFVTDIDGKPFDLFSGRVLLARPGIHARMLEVLTASPSGGETLADTMR